MVENYGDSSLAKRFGVTRYPAIFVDDILVATPKDFGFYGKGEGAENGRYAPWKSAESHNRFRADLSRMIDLILEGKKAAARKTAGPARAGELARIPAFSVTKLDGTQLSAGSLSGRVVIVEFWATWCPPCRGTLRWLGELKKRHGDRLTVVTVAVDSDEANVKKLAGELDLPFEWAMGTPEMVRAFGDVSAVPALFVFDGKGRSRGSYFGAAPDLHPSVEKQLASLLK
ncbi:MAG: Thiol-disulfide oxidoreductase ResA [Thermoanaerobaculia bacterium]|nr:Thiol-disulfide oxidoreductase ResA [Thermoanaerobaculia bacterium]